MESMPTRGLLGGLALALVLLTGAGAADRPKDLAILKGKMYKTPWTASHFRLFTEPLFGASAAQGLAPEWVDMDIFLIRNKPARDQYKRILLSSAFCWFTPEMHEGIRDYVRSGGLLITNNPLGGVDRNSNRKYDPLDAWMGRPGNPVVGARGASNGNVSRIKVALDCPLTAGLPRGGWARLQGKVPAKQARNVSATVVIVSDFIRKRYPPEQPCVLVKRDGAGACVYIAPRIYGPSLKDPLVSAIFKNTLSVDTLEWLTKAP